MFPHELPPGWALLLTDGNEIAVSPVCYGPTSTMGQVVALCVHCVRTTCMLCTQRPGYSPKNTCHLTGCTSKQQSPHENNETAFNLVVQCPYEQTTQSKGKWGTRATRTREVVRENCHSHVEPREMETWRHMCEPCHRRPLASSVSVPVASLLEAAMRCPLTQIAGKALSVVSWVMGTANRGKGRAVVIQY